MQPLCSPAALAQIMTRLDLDVLGRPSTTVANQGPWTTWRTMIFITSFYVFVNAVILFGVWLKLGYRVSISAGDLSAFILVNLAFFAFTVYTVATTRGIIRDRFRILESRRFRGKEDYIAAAFCMPCTISQMGRHTVPYEEKEASCCTENGLSHRKPASDKEFELV